MTQLRALGVLDLRNSEGVELGQVLAQPKRAALLTYLALASPRGAHPRDKLLAVFWPDQDTEHARNALSQAVHFLRRALGDDVLVSQNGDSLAVADGAIWCDVLAFGEALDAGRQADAVELYRGDFLEGFHVANAPEFERWLDELRAQLGARLDAALETLATQCERAGNHAAALNHSRRLAARTPYNTGHALRLMRALAAGGDTAAAVRHAQIHESLLRKELDLPVPAEVKAFVVELQARRPVASAPLRPPAEPAVEGDQRPAPVARRPFKAGRRVAILTAALATLSVGAAAAFVTGSRDSKSDELMALYRRGRSAEVSRSQVGVLTAAQYYRMAIARDSGFALGYAGLSQAYTYMAFYDFAPKFAALDSARILAQRALALDSMLPETRTVVALALANSGHFAEAEREYRRAIELGPGSTEARTSYGQLLVALGRGPEALAQMDTVFRNDPVAPRVAHNIKMQATYLMTGQRPHLKLPPADRRPILKVEPGEPWARLQTAAELADEGRCADARSELSIAQRLVPDSNMLMLGFVGLIEWSCGDRARARSVLGRLKRRPNVDEHALRVAILYTRFGEKDSAFVWLKRQRWTLGGLAMLSGAPFLDSLRSDRRFPQLLRSIGVR